MELKGGVGAGDAGEEAKPFRMEFASPSCHSFLVGPCNSSDVGSDDGEPSTTLLPPLLGGGELAGVVPLAGAIGGVGGAPGTELGGLLALPVGLLGFSGGVLSVSSGLGPMLMSGEAESPDPCAACGARILSVTTAPTSARNDAHTTTPALFSRVMGPCLLVGRICNPSGRFAKPSYRGIIQLPSTPRPTIPLPRVRNDRQPGGASLPVHPSGIIGAASRPCLV
jgi:hypothetical protein